MGSEHSESPTPPIQAMEEGRASTLETTICPATQSAPDHVTVDIKPTVYILVGGNWSAAHGVHNMLSRDQMSSMNTYMKFDPSLTDLRKVDIVIMVYEASWGEPPSDATWFMRQLQSLRLQSKSDALTGPQFYTLEFHMPNEPPTLGKLVSALGGQGRHWTQAIPAVEASTQLWVETVVKCVRDWVPRQ